MTNPLHVHHTSDNTSWTPASVSKSQFQANEDSIRTRDWPNTEAFHATLRKMSNIHIYLPQMTIAAAPNTASVPNYSRARFDHASRTRTFTPIGARSARIVQLYFANLSKSRVGPHYHAQSLFQATSPSHKNTPGSMNIIVKLSNTGQILFGHFNTCSLCLVQIMF